MIFVIKNKMLLHIPPSININYLIKNMVETKSKHLMIKLTHFKMLNK